MGTSDDGIDYETELWQIVRFHAFDIKVEIELTPDHGNVFYRCELTVDGMKYYFRGVNLWKRYRDMVEVLKRLYGENAYKYGTKPIIKE